MKLSIAEKLRRFYDQFSGEDRVLIIINADPDAIASAIASGSATMPTIKPAVRSAEKVFAE